MLPEVGVDSRELAIRSAPRTRQSPPRIAGRVQRRRLWGVDPHDPAAGLTHLLDEARRTNPVALLRPGVRVGFHHRAHFAWLNVVGAIQVGLDALAYHLRELGHRGVGQFAEVD